ncbi:hypothetical protein [Chromobacterium amazonense]|nr:hypothetical protein [Chromobacterium amazonense]
MDQQTSDHQASNTPASNHAEEQKQKRKRVTVEDREKALQDKIAQMQAELEKLKQQKLEQQAKKLDKMWKRLRVHMVSLGLTDVPSEAIEALLSEHADKLRQASVQD